MDHPFKHLYFDCSYGIYVHGLNRFILVDTDDLLVTASTARALSSKMVSSICVLPASARFVNNTNCLGYSIVNEDDNISRPGWTIGHLPILRVYNDCNNFSYLGINEEFKLEMQIREYANYVQKVMYNVHYLSLIYNPTFEEITYNANMHLQSSYRRLETSKMFQAIRHAAYHANSVDELKSQVEQIFTTVPHLDYIVSLYYAQMAESNPVKLTEAV